MKTEPRIITHGMGVDPVLPAGRCSHDTMLVVIYPTGTPEVFTPRDGRWVDAYGGYARLALLDGDRWFIVDPSSDADLPGSAADIAAVMGTIGPLPLGWTMARMVRLMMKQREQAGAAELGLSGAIKELFKSTGIVTEPGDDLGEVLIRLAHRGGFTWDGEL